MFRLLPIAMILLFMLHSVPIWKTRIPKYQLFPYLCWSRFKHLLWRRFSSYLQLIPTCCPLSISLFSTRNCLYWSIPNRLIVEGMCLLFVDELTSTTRELVAWFVQMKGELPFRIELESLSISQYDINSIFGASTPKPKSMKYESTSVAWFLELISGRLCVISFVAKRNRYTHQRQMIQAPLQWVNPFHQQLLLLKMWIWTIELFSLIFYLPITPFWLFYSCSWLLFDWKVLS